MRFWLRQWKWRILRWWYRAWYGMRVAIDGTMMAQLGKGKYVSVLRRGPCLELTSHGGSTRGMIRLIPYQPNHGVMVEFHTLEGKIRGRTHCDYDRFYAMVRGNEEEQESGDCDPSTMDARSLPRAEAQAEVIRLRALLALREAQ